MINLRTYDINQKTTNKKVLSMRDINFEFDKSPAIYVDTNKHVAIEGTKISIDNESISMNDILVVDVVKWLILNGVDAKIINAKYASYPAVFISDIDSSDARIGYTEISPQELMALGVSYPEAIYDINNSIEYEVVRASIDDESQEYDVINNRIYCNPNSKIVFNEKYVKFIMNIQSSKAVNVLPLSEYPDTAISLFAMEAMTYDGN